MVESQERMLRSIDFWDAFRFWLKLGFISFGGPAGQIAIMHRELVENRRWISEQRFLHALNYCMLLPGREAQQLSVYIGWLLHRTWGGIVAGLLFILPSLFILIVLTWIYLAFQDAPVYFRYFLWDKAGCYRDRYPCSVPDWITYAQQWAALGNCMRSFHCYLCT